MNQQQPTKGQFVFWCLIGIAGCFWLLEGFIRHSGIDSEFAQRGVTAQVVSVENGHMRRTRAKMITNVEASVTVNYRTESGETGSADIDVTDSTFYRFKVYTNGTGTLAPGSDLTIRILPGNPNRYLAGSDKMTDFNVSLWWLLVFVPVLWAGGKGILESA
jgi:hypothetical protein